jgi:hypothetical protein
VEVSARDPFAVTANPDAYVARPASEAALEAIEGALRSGATRCVLTGPPGIGKTMLLRVLERRLADAARCVYVPYAALGFDDLCRWLLGLLGESPRVRGSKPGERLLAAARRLVDGEGRWLQVLLDDASALPPSSARGWVALEAEAAGALRLVAVPVDDGRAGRVIAVLGRDAVTVRYSVPLDLRETEAFVHERLARASASPDALARFDGRVLARLHGASAGNPRRLLRLAIEVLRGEREPGLHEDDEADLLLEFDALAPPAQEVIALAPGAAPRGLAPGLAPGGASGGASEEPAASPPGEAPPVDSATCLDDARRSSVAPDVPQPSASAGRKAQSEAAALAAAPARDSARPRAPAPDADSPRAAASSSPGSRAPAVRAPRRRRRQPLRPWAAVAVAAVLLALAALALRPTEPGPAPLAAPAAPRELPPVSVGPSPRAEAPEPAAAPALAPIPVNINAVPWAYISVDGRDLGATPLADVPLLPGPRLFRAELPDGTIVERTVEISAAERHVSFAAPEAPPAAPAAP